MLQAMDPLSDVLSMVKARAYAFRGLDTAGDWAIALSARPVVRCYALLRGQCWLRVHTTGQVRRVEAGDFLLLPHGDAVTFASDPELPPQDGKPLFEAVADGEDMVINGGGEAYGVGGFFAFDSREAEMLVSGLPSIVHLPSHEDRSVLLWYVRRLIEELREPQPGSALVAGHLWQTLLIHALRAHLADPGVARAGWLAALADRQISAAMTAIHRDCARRWTLASLAAAAGMSRSAFAARFKDILGTPPMEYVTQWRMMIAADRLRRTTTSISTIATTLGYDSDSAFGAAFKRATGQSPRRFARNLDDAGADPSRLEQLAS